MRAAIVPTGILLLMSLGLAACATPYQPYSFWNGGGFSETEVQPGLFLVRFMGNEQTTPDRTADFALLRAADLCLQRGRDYLLLGDLATQYVNTGYLPGTATTTVIPDQPGNTSVTVDTSPPTMLYSPASGITVTCVEAHGGGAWDARYLARAIRTKYALS
jgi:hypothetical protein